MYKVLFICTGNICRSPTAEGVMRHLLNERGLSDKVFVDSAGVSNWHAGESSDKSSVACAKSFGVDISDLRSRPLLDEDFKNFDLILGMDSRNMAALQTIGEKIEVEAKIDRLLNFAPSYGENVPDPYYNDGFDYVFEMISVACDNLIQHLISNKLL